jgi:hypothetical protein
VTNHGSPEVRRLLEAWSEQRRNVEDADATIQLAEGARAVDSELDQEAQQKLRALPSYRAGMREAADAIRTQMWAELRGQARPVLERGDPASM